MSVNLKIGGPGTVEQFRACVHCRHFQARAKQPRCGRPEALNGTWDLVFGQRRLKGAYEMRDRNGPCGPSGKLWEAHRRPLRDTAAAVSMATSSALAGMAGLPGRLNGARRAMGQRVRHAIAERLVAPERPKPLDAEAIDAATDQNVTALREAAAQMREGQPIEPLPPADKPEPKPEPKPEDKPADPSPLPQTDGKFPLERDSRQEAKLGVLVVVACLLLMAGMMAASILGERRAVSATDRTFGGAPHWCYPQGETDRATCYTVRRRKATCCYRWHDGTTRCFDCSDTAAHNI